MGSYSTVMICLGGNVDLVRPLHRVQSIGNSAESYQPLDTCRYQIQYNAQTRHGIGKTRSTRLGYRKFFKHTRFLSNHINISKHLKKKNQRYPFQKQTLGILKLELLTQKIKENEEEKTQRLTRSEIRGETTEG